MESISVTGAGLFLYGIGTGVWDVAMNVEGADVERRLGRTIMPRFHAGFSLGTVIGAGVGALAVPLEVPLPRAPRRRRGRGHGRQPDHPRASCRSRRRSRTRCPA